MPGCETVRTLSTNRAGLNRNRRRDWMPCFYKSRGQGRPLHVAIEQMWSTLVRIHFQRCTIVGVVAANSETD
jgi:hypothetical protein